MLKIIVGGGPNGLYAAFQLFLSGLSVTLVNDRPEKYTRNQIINIDPNYMFQLQILLGTSYSRLFFEKESPGKIVHEHGQINLKHIETAMKDRLKGLLEYVNQKQHKKDDLLKLVFGQAVEKIKFPTTVDPNYYAVLKSSSSNHEIPFDLLVCASGFKDKIRDTYLAIPKEYTVPKNYGVAVFVKGKNYKEKSLLNKKH
uniref:FAD-binding domain-containing protein n=1 Tax=Ditylenchus dipsaci TaxID=166011 RepID=A0A915EKN8_9BILA